MVVHVGVFGGKERKIGRKMAEVRESEGWI